MKLDDIRKKVDSVDDTLLDLLVKRLQLAQKVSNIKKKNLLPIEDKSRENKILARLKIQAVKKGLSSSFVMQIFQLILAESKRVQRKVKS